jgi:hypothetical protein
VRLVYARTSVDTFEVRNAERLGRAAGFSRASPGVRARVVRGARLYSERLGWTLNQAAGRLAHRYRLGHETVRQILLRHDESVERPIFARRPPLSVMEQRMALRAYERGLTPANIARRLGRTKASIHRVINQRRAGRLRRVPPPPDREAAFELEGVELSLLAPAAVNEGFGSPFPTDPASLVALAHAMPPVDAAIEHARAAAMRFLWWRGTRPTRGGASRPPRSTILDRAETDLRWMLRLKAELLRAELPLIVRAVEERAGRGLREIDAGAACELLSLSLGAASAAIDRHDPMRGGRVAAPVSLAISRALAHPVPSRSGDAPMLADWSIRLTSWQSRFEPDPRLRRFLPELPVEIRAPVALRFGWGLDQEGAGSHPRTRAEVRASLGLSPQAQMSALRRALTMMRAASAG